MPKKVLNPETRKIFEKRLRENVTLSEIARELNCSRYLLHLELKQGYSANISQERLEARLLSKMISRVRT